MQIITNITVVSSTFTCLKSRWKINGAAEPERNLGITKGLNYSQPSDEENLEVGSIMGDFDHNRRFRADILEG